jgi:hypothetical protein
LKVLLYKPPKPLVSVYLYMKLVKFFVAPIRKNTKDYLNNFIQVEPAISSNATFSSAKPKNCISYFLVLESKYCRKQTHVKKRNTILSPWRDIH